MLKWSICCHSEALNNSISPRIQRPDAFFTSNPEQSVEHPPISDLHAVRLPLNLETRFCEINGKRTCKIQLWVKFQIKSRSTFLCILVLYLKAALFFISVIECPTLSLCGWECCFSCSANRSSTNNQGSLYSPSNVQTRQLRF